MKKDVYRKAALERIASVDQLDRVLKISSPLSWLALTGVALMVVLVTIWSLQPLLPATVTATGVVVNASAGTNTIFAQADGTVQLKVSRDDVVNEKDVVAVVTRNGETTEVLADQRGYVASVLVENGAVVNYTTELLRIRPYVTAGQKDVVVCYVPKVDADKIKLGQHANITLAAHDSGKYGHMEARVINKDGGPTSSTAVEGVVGKDNNEAAAFMQQSSVCAVTLELEVPENAVMGSGNGYWWSNPQGYRLTISDRATCSVKITTETVRPITLVFAKLKEIWGE